jgi:hypothetical protein
MKPAIRAIGHVLKFSGVFSMDPMNAEHSLAVYVDVDVGDVDISG